MHVSDAELVVLESLWEAYPRSSDEIIQAVSDRRDWKPSTVKTLIRRLHDKGALTRSRHGRGYRYAPAIAREAYVLEESRSLVDRLFGGRISPLVAQWASREGLNAEDTESLRRLLRKLDESADQESDE